MKLRKIKEEIDNLDLPVSQNNSVISLVELVIKHDMEKIMSEIKVEFKSLKWLIWYSSCYTRHPSSTTT